MNKKFKTWIPAFAGMTMLLLSQTAYGLKQGGHVKASLVSDVKSVQPGSPFWVAVRLEMQPRWHTYWKNAGESGAPTEITWQLPEGFSAGPIEWPAPKRIVLDPIVSYGYEDEVLLMAKITPPAVFRDTKPISLKAHVSWLECEVVCVPGEADVSLTLPLLITPPEPQMEWMQKFSRARFDWPIVLPDWNVRARQTPTGFRLAVLNTKDAAQKPADLTFFAEDPNVITYSAVQSLGEDGADKTLDLIKSDASTSTVTRLRGVLVAPNGWRGPNSETALSVDVPIETAPQEPSAPPVPVKRSLWTALLFAFIGGLILNLMPCVLPVLSIKILSFVKQAGEDPKAVLAHGLVFSAGVIVSFWALAGTLLFLRAGGQQLGWGFQLQSPVFVGAMAALFFVLALNLFGVFEIGTSFTRLSDLNRGKSGFSGSFFNGVLATIVATPCTAPFMGSALGYAVTQPAWAAMLIFTSLGTGMAAPYMVLSANPNLLKFVPKPGPWMEKMKKGMGVLFLLTVLWLVWVLSQQLAARNATAPQTGEPTAALAWEPYSGERVEELRRQGRRVFVDFTAAWCLTCQVNERVVLNSKTVADAFKEKNIALLKADWTSQDPKITQALAAFGRSGVPFYVLYPVNTQAQPVTLPEILTKQIVLDAINKE